MAASAHATASTAPPSLHYDGWTREECSEGCIHALATQLFRELVADYQARQAEAETKVSAAARGFWYGNDNYEALAKHAPKNPTALTRLEALKKAHKFFHGHPPTGFAHVRGLPQFTGLAMTSYVLEDGAIPSEALHACRTSFCILDCGGLVQLARYEALHQIMGTEKFNAHFSQATNRLALNPATARTPLFNENLSQSFVTGHLARDAPDIRLGDDVHFKNIPLYSIRHPNGEGGGFHTVCIASGDSPEFTGFGLEDRGYTEVDMLQVLVDEFNSEPLGPDTAFTPDLDAKTEPKGAPPEVLRVAREMTLTLANFQEAIRDNPQLLIGRDAEVSRLNVAFIRSLS